MNRLALAALLCTAVCLSDAAAQQYIRVNQLGYQPAKTKNAVWCAKNAAEAPAQFLVLDAKSRKVVWQGKASKDFGAYGPFSQTCRLDFSGFRQTGRFFLRAGDAESPVFQIAADVYDKAPDAVRKTVLVGLISWFVLDSSGSIASGNTSNAVINILVLLTAVGPLWRPAKS